jgi:hypothetical protein
VGDRRTDSRRRNRDFDPQVIGYVIPITAAFCLLLAAIVANECTSTSRQGSWRNISLPVGHRNDGALFEGAVIPGAMRQISLGVFGDIPVIRPVQLSSMHGVGEIAPTAS